MLVGTKVIPRDKLKEACKSKEDLEAFAISLVPRVLRHVDSVINNQKYLVAVEIRSLRGLLFLEKKHLTESILEGVYITGSINTLIDMEDLLISTNADLLFKEVFKEEIKANENRERDREYYRIRNTV